MWGLKKREKSRLTPWGCSWIILVISVAFIALRGLPSKELSCNAGNPGSFLGSGRFSGEGNGHFTPVLLPKFHGQRSSSGLCSPWGHKASDTNKGWTVSFFFLSLSHFYFKLESLESWQLGSGESEMPKNWTWRWSSVVMGRKSSLEVSSGFMVHEMSGDKVGKGGI